jgi:hypothetical protein
MKYISCTLIVFLSLIFLILISGCNYYRVITKTRLIPEDVRWEDFNQKYLILHFGDSAWYIRNISVDRKFLTGSLSPLPGNHMMYLETDPAASNRFTKSHTTNYEGDVITEVHLYTFGPIVTKDTIVSMDFSSIYKMEVYNYDVRKSRNTYMVPVIVGVTVVGSALVIYGFVLFFLALGSFMGGW